MKRGFLNSSKAKKEPLYPGPGGPPAVSATPAATKMSTATEPPKNKGKERAKADQPSVKLAYGKVDKSSLPESYEPPELKIVEMDPTKVDHSEDLLLMTTIPSRAMDGPNDPDGHSEWIVLGPTKAKVVKHPEYPRPIPKLFDPEPAFEIKDTPDTVMGKGMFARRDIQVGELIFAERPLLVSPRNINVLGGTYVPEEKKNDLRAVQAVMMHEWEKLLEAAVNRMTEENQKAFKELMNNHTDDGSGPLLGIVRTNAFSMEEIYDGEAWTDATAYTAVLKLGSRINHSCLPNVTYTFSVPSFSFLFHAQLDIKAGEQLFYSYCETQQSKARRAAELAPYKIECTCPACERATPETDALRTGYKKRAREHTSKIRQWLALADSSKGAPGGAGSSKDWLDESMLEEALKFRDALRNEGLKYTKEYRAIVWNVHLFYEKIGLDGKSKEFLEEYSELEDASVLGASSI